MDFRKNGASCTEAKQMDMVSYLSTLGYEPARIRSSDYWYYSPLRSEKTPSFKVNRRLNRWYDHGIGKGGNLIDFAILYNNCTVGEFLKMARGHFSLHQPNAASHKQEAQETNSPITIVKEGPLTSSTLYRYLHQRRIPIEVAKQYCSEVIYELSGKHFFAIGFKNNAGGWELRNPYFKGSSSPKDTTTFENGAQEIAVFEGFFDFLSFMSIMQNSTQMKSNFLVLNSVAFFEKARPIMEGHQVINFYLDRDKTGQDCTRHALSLSPKYEDRSSLYQNHKDLNDWVMNIGKVSRQRPKRKKGLKY
jgi:hypothetical protein